MSIRLERGKRYAAELVLPVLATEGMAIARLTSFGFVNVETFRGRGKLFVRGTWNKPSAVVELPGALRNVSIVTGR